MKKQVYMRVKLDPDLRRAFQLSAWRSERSPTNVLRSLIQDCVNLDRSAQGVDLYVWGDSFPVDAGVKEAPGRCNSRR